MSECILTRFSAGSGSNGNVASNGMKTEIFISNTYWVVPKDLKNNNISVRIFGGGGAGVEDGWNAGGGGWMNNNIIQVSPGQVIPIIIGRGGSPGSEEYSVMGSGGTTFFGNYLSANGGEFGFGSGGAGGSGGGAGNNGDGGRGYQFGGGDGGSDGQGGSGGMWGGGGACNRSFNIGKNNSILGLGGIVSVVDNVITYSGLAGNGGNGNRCLPTNGTNSIGLGLEFEGPGTAGAIGSNNNYGGGGGGYGGCGGNNRGGGGGYGANGGEGTASIGGGGGGYGGRGGHASERSGGGGGGYGLFGNGGDGHRGNGGIAAGGGGDGGWGRDGICIIQYYI